MAYIIRVVVMFLITWTGIRMIGRKSISEMTSYDLAAVMLMTTVAAEPLVYKITSKSIIAVVVLIFLTEIVGNLTLKRFFYKIDARPITIIKDGEIIEKSLKEAEMNIPLLLSELRINGYNKVSDIKYAYLETNGKISVIPKAEAGPVTPRMLDLDIAPITLTIPLIVNGEVEENNLYFLQKDREWLEEKLKSHGVVDIDSVLLAQYDTKGKLFINLRDRRLDMPDLV